MNEQEWEDIQDLVSKMEGGKYKCGMAAHYAIMFMYAVIKRIEVEGIKAFLNDSDAITPEEIANELVRYLMEGNP